MLELDFGAPMRSAGGAEVYTSSIVTRNGYSCSRASAVVFSTFVSAI
jgi:hypothetical protein